MVISFKCNFPSTFISLLPSKGPLHLQSLYLQHVYIHLLLNQFCPLSFKSSFLSSPYPLLRVQKIHCIYFQSLFFYDKKVLLVLSQEMSIPSSFYSSTYFLHQFWLETDLFSRVVDRILSNPPKVWPIFVQQR